MAGAVAAGLGQAAALIAQAAVLSGLLAAALRGELAMRGAVRASLAVLVLGAVQGLACWAWETCADGTARRARSAARRAALIRAMRLAASTGGPLRATPPGSDTTPSHSDTTPSGSGQPADTAGPGPGALTVLLGAGIDELDPFVGRVVPRAVLAVLAPALLVAWIAGLDLPSAGIAVPVLLLSPVMAALAGLGTAQAVRRRLASLERIGDRFTALIEGLPLLRAYGRAGDHERAVAASGEEARTASLAAVRLALLAGLVLELAAAVGTALVAVPLGLRLDAGHRILPQALAVLMLTPELFLPLRRLTADFHAGASGQAALARISAVTGEPDRGGDPGPGRRTVIAETRAVGGRGDPAAPAAITMDAVSVVVPGRARPVLDQVSLRVAPGERVGVAGPSGAGKSTLLRVAAGLISPSAGHLSSPLDGVWGPGLASGARPALGWVPQHPAVLDGTVLDNVALGRPGISAATARAALEDARLGSWLTAQPAGLDTRLTSMDARLSLGELRRLAVARVLAGPPPALWLLDEPTSGLDDVTARELIGALAAAIGGATALIASHDPAVLALADHVLEINEGRVRGPRPGPRSGRPDIAAREAAAAAGAAAAR
jgi:ABC-type transport system involved in cytochrome bd biosynthesis fused ATPase/permease subunit